MRILRAIAMLAAGLTLAAATGIAELRAATEDEPARVEKKKSNDLKDILIPIPSFSKDVESNGCHVRKDPHEVFVGPDVDIQHVAFSDLISETIGRYSVRASLDSPEKFNASLVDLDPDTRTLVFLDVLRD